MVLGFASVRREVKNAKEQKLIDALEPAATAHGFDLVDVELGGAGNARIVRVYLDKPGGLVIDDIAAANSWADAVVEANVPFRGAYTLELSSPGIDRPLRTRQHFERFVGEEVKLSTERIDGRANWTGVLDGVDGEDLLLQIDGQCHRLPLASIKKAHVKGRVEL